MSIGATEGKEPDAIADADLRTPDELRGDMKAIHMAKLSLNEKATVEGCLTKMNILEQRMEMQAEQMERIIGMYATLRDEFLQYRQQRVVELQSWLAKGGSTTPEDNNGSYIKSGN